MSKFWKATSVNATNGSAIVTVNTGDDVALVRANSLLQIGALQVVEVKTVNTSNQTIELFDAWNGGSISGQSAIAAPSAAELAQAIDDVRTLTTAYEGIADDVSVNPSADSIVKRTSAGRVKTATPSAADDAVNLGYVGTAVTRDVGTATGDVLEVGGLGYALNNNTLPLPPNNNLDTVRQIGLYRVQNDTVGKVTVGGAADVGVVEHFVRLGDEGIGRHFQEYRTQDGDKRYFRDMLADGSWSEWFIIYHSGNSVNPLDYGLGTNSPETITNWDDAKTTGFYRSANPTQTNSPDDSRGGWFGVVAALNIDNAHQTLHLASNVKVSTFERVFQLGVWTPWQEIYHSGNLINAQNISGSTVASNGTVAGSGLTPAKAGTWRNISGNDIAANGYGLWRLL